MLHEKTLDEETLDEDVQDEETTNEDIQHYRDGGQMDAASPEVDWKGAWRMTRRQWRG